MTDSIQQYAEGLTRRIGSFETSYQIRNIGKVIEAGDGIAQVEGLTEVRAQELVKFSNNTLGIAFNLEKEKVGVIILGDYSTIFEGMSVETTGRIASIPVGDRLIGRVVNALGQPIDGKGELKISDFHPLEKIAPGVIERRDVDTPVQTGIKSIDAMIPIGRGQRELIIGDRQTGKTAIAIDTIINQKGKNLICIYVAIGQKKAAVARTVALLERYGAMEHTIIVSASADEAAAMLYIAPYAGCAIGEDFMQRGFDALVVYDDLSKHAWAYRQLSLLLRRPPGREAYPGDVFYLHSRLLERAACMAYEYCITSSEYKSSSIKRELVKEETTFKGPMAMHDAEKHLADLADKKTKKIVKVEGTGGSLTALPIIETLLGDVSAYIPTNVISITDGQIYLEGSLFNAGIRPAVNVGISVSRVGGAAQTKAMKQVAGRLRLDMANFRELAAFAQFGSDLDKTTLGQLNRGFRLQEILKQPQYEPETLSNQVVLFYAGVNGFSDSIPLEKMKKWQTDLLRFFETSYPKIIKSIVSEQKITPDTEDTIKTAISLFNSSWN
jgi:F-type H+-transporting ATPase subunit alpha